MVTSDAVGDRTEPVTTWPEMDGLLKYMRRPTNKMDGSMDG